jgi:hypothetical protein
VGLRNDTDLRTDQIGYTVFQLEPGAAAGSMQSSL